MKEQYFKAYSAGSKVGKWAGWIEIDGKCQAFVDKKGRITWMSDLGIEPK